MPKSSQAPQSPPSDEVFEGLASAKDMADLGLELISHLPLAPDEAERDPYLISFKLYNHNMCGIYELKNPRAKKALDLFKQVLTQVRSNTDLNRLRFPGRPVPEGGHYKKLYSTLPTEGELWECDLSRTSRLFFYPNQAASMFYVIAIRETHLETKKNWR